LPVSFSRLRIAGFKSFAEPANVEIRPGLTGIVGPNGCGKSNVVEALRWAMGESSVRSLRGGEMEDVIFAGTTARPARNIAEVTLTLDDTAGVAPPPFHVQQELEVVRRIERGMGSSYHGRAMCRRCLLIWRRARTARRWSARAASVRWSPPRPISGASCWRRRPGSPVCILGATRRS
jgi:energy-coupling factor transporter ATP-binding protein EcfA2